MEAHRVGHRLGDADAPRPELEVGVFHLEGDAPAHEPGPDQAPRDAAREVEEANLERAGLRRGEVADGDYAPRRDAR